MTNELRDRYGREIYLYVAKKSKKRIDSNCLAQIMLDYTHVETMENGARIYVKGKKSGRLHCLLIRAGSEYLPSYSEE